MKKATAFLVFSMAAACDAFTVVPQHELSKVPFFATVQENVVKQPQPEVQPQYQSTDVLNRIEDSILEATVAPKVAPKPKKSKTSKAKGSGGAVHKQGIFSPAVLLAKDVLGEKELNKLRAKAIGLHSDVIGKFVETSQSRVGETVLRQLFHLADEHQNGTIDQDELTRALRALGFDHLKEKQIKGIFERADVDKSGGLDFAEWKQEAPKTSRTNWIKLAKKNGGDLGFLV